MTRGFVFWLLMILWLIFGFVAAWPDNAVTWRSYAPVGNTVLLFALFFLLGWQAFGFIIRDSDPPK